MKKLFVFKIIIISSFFLSSIFSENIYDKNEYPPEDSGFDDSDRPDNENNFKFCKNEGPLTEYIYYIYEMEHNFNTWVNKDNAHYLVEMAKFWNCYKTEQNSEEREKCKNKYNESYYKYLERLGPYFFFVAFAGVVFFTWILLWYCMLYPKCCCKESSNEKNFKYFSFIMVLICLAGMFACIISSFVYSHRWNNRLNGITCAIERLYYNMYYGQKNYRKGTWRGFNGLYYVLFDSTNKINKKNHKINTKIKENSFNEDKKKFRLLEETKNLISKNKSNFSNFLIEKNFTDNYTDDKKNTSNDSNLKSISKNDSKSNISLLLPNFELESSFSKFSNLEKNDEYSFKNIKEEENSGVDGYELDKEKIFQLANAFKKLKPKLFNSYHKVKRALKGLGYYGYFAIYSILFVIVTLLVLPHIFFAFCPGAMCKRYNSLLLIIGWNCIMLFTLYSFFLTAFLGMVDYASIDMIGFFKSYFMEENLLPEKRPAEGKYFLIPHPLIGEIFHFCLYNSEESMLNHEFNYFKNDENIQNSENYNYYKDINNLNKDINFNNNMNKKDNNKDFNINEQLLNKKHKNIRNLGAILDPDWESDLPLFENTKCSYLKNDINMLYTSFYSFSHMDKKFVAITASISYLGYICAIFMVFTLKKFESHWTKKGKYNYGNDNDDDNSSSDDSSVNNIKKNNNKKIKNNIKIDENLKKNLIDTNIIHKKKKSFDNNNISNNEEENEEDEE